MNSRFSRLVLAASVLVWTACSGKKDVTNPPVTTASITVAAGSPTLSVAQNAAGTSTIAVARTNFTGDVALTAEGLPTGVTATFTPAALTSGGTSSSLSLAVSGTAALTNSTPAQITIRARGTGVTDATATLALTITASVGGAVTVTATPVSASITAGQQASTVVKITRAGGFTGGVNLTVTGAPTGMTTTLSSSNPFTGDSLNLSISTLTSVTPGSYSLLVRANSAGLTEATAPYTVNVAAPPSNSVTWRFCDTNRIPLWFAYLDGLSGTWQRVTETTPGVYTFAYGQPQVGVAAVYNEGSRVVTRVAYYGLSEVAGAAAAECTQNPVAGTKTLTGAISGFASATEVGLVSMGSALSNSTNQSNTSFTLNSVPNGALDLIAIRADLVSSNVARLLLKRGVDSTSGKSLGTLDLAGGTSFAPATGTVTVTAPNDATISAQNLFTTATGSSASFTMPALSSGVSQSYQGVPLAQMVASDLQQVIISQSVGTTTLRSIARYTREPLAITGLSMPPDPAFPTVTTVSGGTYPRATASGTMPGFANNRVLVSFNQSSSSRRWDMFSTTAGLATAGSYSFTMPNFSAVAGWNNAWALSSGTANVTGTFIGQTGANPDGTPTSGTIIYTIGRQTTFTF